jgi:hypothetical protein
VNVKNYTVVVVFVVVIIIIASTPGWNVGTKIKPRRGSFGLDALVRSTIDVLVQVLLFFESHTARCAVVLMASCFKGGLDGSSTTRLFLVYVVMLTIRSSSGEASSCGANVAAYTTSQQAERSD